MLPSRCGLDFGICRYAGKGQGEVSLLRRMWGVLSSGDILLADCLTANWTSVVMLQGRGLELVSRLNKAHRKADFRRGKRLGQDDHIVRWRKPTSIRSVDRTTYNSLPESLTIREVRFRVEQPSALSRVDFRVGVQASACFFSLKAALQPQSLVLTMH